MNKAPGADLPLRTELLLALGDADARTGDLDKARLNFLKAADLAREIGSGTMLARAALGYGGRHQWARAGHDTRLIPLLRAALEQHRQRGRHAACQASDSPGRRACAATHRNATSATPRAS